VIGGALAMALRSLARNRLRSSLTMLGVVIGVAAVIALVTIGRSVTEHVTGEIDRLGDNLVWVQPGGTRGGGQAAPLRVADAEAIARELPSVRVVAPSVTMGERATFGKTTWPTRIWGVTETFFDVRRLDVSLGRPFTQAEIDSGASVCLLGPTVRDELFAGADPLGQSVRIRTMTCRVVGVLTGSNSSVTDDEDDLVLLPLGAVHRRLAGNHDLNIIFVSARDGRSTALVSHQITTLMRERRRIADGADDDFRLRSLDEATDKVRKVTGILTALLGAIAAVSLVVGGIGIMNIMLVSVTERTREIGIRLAIGARGPEVLTQFLVEAITLATIGGVIGILLGLGGSAAATGALEVPLRVQPSVVVVSFFFSALVGVLFGFLPARRAARLHPIEALRHE
jgi:putative ABC transport system permease protein